MLTPSEQFRPETAGIRSRLKEATAAIHDRLDKSELALMIVSPAVTVQDYAVYLQKTYGFVKPIEEAILFSAPASANRELVAGPQMSALIESDMRALGMDQEKIEKLPVLKDPPLIEDLYQLMGTLYVMRGSMMGGLTIAKHLRSVNVIEGNQTASFFTAYGTPQETGMSFMRFITNMESLVSGNNRSADEVRKNGETVIAAAIATFECIDRWINVPNSSPAQDLDSLTAAVMELDPETALEIIMIRLEGWCRDNQQHTDQAVLIEQDKKMTFWVTPKGDRYNSGLDDRLNELDTEIARDPRLRALALDVMQSPAVMLQDLKNTVNIKRIFCPTPAF